MIEPAAKYPHCCEKPPTKKRRPTGAVYMSSWSMKVAARMNSFHAGHEREQRGHRHRGLGERQDDAEEDHRLRGAVDERRLLELLGNGVEVSLEHPDAEGDRGRRVDEHEAGERRAQAEP